MVRIALTPEQYFDDEGRPLAAGRVTVTYNGSDIPVELWFRDGDDYVAAPNPFLTAADGRVPTVFFDAAVVDVRVEKALPDGTYEPLDTYKYGVDIPEESQATEVSGISGLRDADPSLGAVFVTGYYDAYDAPRRLYVFDENCTSQEDGGCIIDPGNGDPGKWLLVWEDEKLPCSVYGIVPGSEEANIGAFLSYPSIVGSFAIRMPPIPRFFSGNYITTVTMTTAKELYFDAGACFDAKFVCPSATVEPSNTYVADFQFTNQEVAYAAWFRTVKGFLTCGARVLDYGKIDYLQDETITGSVTVTNKIIRGNRRLNLTYGAVSYIMLDSCVIEGKGLFSPSADCIRFRNMQWYQDAFNTTDPNSFDIGTIAFGNCIQFVSVDGNYFDRERFLPDIYVKARIADIKAGNAMTELDAGNAVVTVSIPNGVFTSVRNGTFASISTDACSFDSCRITALEIKSGPVMLKRCEANISLGTGVGTGQLAFYDSSVSVNSRFSLDRFPVHAERTVFNFPTANTGFTPGSSTNYSQMPVTMLGCTIAGTADEHIVASVLIMKDCITSCGVRYIPFDDSGTYRISLMFVNNVVNGSGYLKIAPGMFDAGWMASECEISMMRITGNTFATVGIGGVMCPFWSVVGSTRFIKGSVTTHASVVGTIAMGYGEWAQPFEYSGNTGDCPLEVPPVYSASGPGAGPTVGNITYGLTTVLSSRIFCIPTDSTAGGTRCSPMNLEAMGRQDQISSPTREVYRDCGYPVSCCFPACAIDTTKPNDMFTVHVGIAVDTLISFIKSWRLS